MNMLGEWLRKLVGTVIILGFLELLLPEGELHRFTRVLLGLLVLLILLQPLASLIGQNPALEQILAGQTPVPSAKRPEQAAARVTAAGLEAVERVRRAVMEESLRGAIGEASVVVTSDREGRPRILIRLPRGGDPDRVRRLILSRYALSETAVEVRTDD